MGNCFLHGNGGGTSLNYEVVRYDSEADLPETAKENTIAAFTQVEISRHAFSLAEPTEPIEGMVWFSKAVSSSVSFNALKKNGVTTYPTSAKQYVDGEWVSIQAKIYQDGAWHSFRRYLYKAGDSTADVTAMWTTSTRWVPLNTKKPTLSVSSTGMTATVSDTTMNYMGGLLETTDGVDLTGFKTLVCVVSGYTRTGTDGWTQIGITKDMTGSVSLVGAAVAVSGAGTYTLDISSINGICDILVLFNTSSGAPHTSSITFSEAYLM